MVLVSFRCICFLLVQEAEEKKSYKMDCLASLPKIKDTGCKCITFRTGTIIFSVLHLVFYITVGVFLYDLDPSECLLRVVLQDNYMDKFTSLFVLLDMNFPVVCIFSMACIGAICAIFGSILVSL